MEIIRTKAFQLGIKSFVGSPPTDSPRVLEHRPLIDLARAGDSEAFCELIRPVEDRLYRQAWLFCRDPSAAEDLVQDTMVAAWKSLSRFDGRCALFTWLYAIMLRLWKKRLRTARRKPLTFLGLVTDRWNPTEAIDWAILAKNPSECVEATEMEIRLQQSIERLPDKMKEVIRMRYYADLSIHEISAVTGIPEGTVKSRLSYALERLRALGRREERESS